MYNYTFIIPHKNCVDLLKRCVGSVPERSDVQLIIVDDNSDEEICSLNDFPGSKRPNTDIYFTKEGLGAGYARNVGLSHAKGKWILFADADDFYSPHILDVLDQYLDSDLDVIYFSITSEDMQNLQISKRIGIHKKCIEAYNPAIPGSEDQIKYLRWEPWNKMISKRLIDKHQIRFEEIKKSNDMIFCLLVSYYAKKIEVLNKPLYNITYQKNSLTYGHTSEEAFVYNLRAIKKKNVLLTCVGHGNWRELMLKIHLFYIKKDGIIYYLRLLRKYLGLRKEIHKDIEEFVAQRLSV